MQILPFRLDLFSEGTKSFFTELPPLQVYTFTLNDVNIQQVSRAQLFKTYQSC